MAAGTKVRQIWVSVPAPPLPSCMMMSLSLPVCKMVITMARHTHTHTRGVIIALNEIKHKKLLSEHLVYRLCSMFIYLTSIY